MFAKKSLGQNFIQDENFLKKFSNRIATNSKTEIIEIGSGKGALTKHLIKKNYNKLILIEKDDILINDLNIIKNLKPNIVIKHTDALKYNFLDLNIKSNSVIVGNLPFNISSQLLIKWIMLDKWPPFYEKMYLMFQKELGERIIAKHNTKVYGKISVLSQFRCKIKKLFNAPSNIFYPRPKVEGIVLEFTPYNEYSHINIDKLDLLLKKAFEQRRKKIKTSLKDYKKELETDNFDLNLRAENLSVDDFCRIVNLI